MSTPRAGGEGGAGSAFANETLMLMTGLRLLACGFESAEKASRTETRGHSAHTND
jgi:hypothetical protein